MKNIMLIAGCSHASGSEIDGSGDSQYNRSNSFGNLLANRLGYKPINISISGSTNQGIARSVLDWITSNYNPKKHNLFVLIAWSESSRMEVPSPRVHHYDTANQYTEYFNDENKKFLRVNFGYAGGDRWEQDQSKYYQEFMAKNSEYLEILSANLVLQLQYFLKLNRVQYLMCNTMNMFTDNTYVKTYIDKIDQAHYFNMLDTSQSFWYKYKNLGFTNPKAKYWHHGEEPHKQFSEELYQFIRS